MPPLINACWDVFAGSLKSCHANADIDCALPLIRGMDEIKDHIGDVLANVSQWPQMVSSIREITKGSVRRVEDTLAKKIESRSLPDILEHQRHLSLLESIIPKSVPEKSLQDTVAALMARIAEMLNIPASLDGLLSAAADPEASQEVDFRSVILMLKQSHLHSEIPEILELRQNWTRHMCDRLAEQYCEAQNDLASMLRFLGIAEQVKENLDSIPCLANETAAAASELQCSLLSKGGLQKLAAAAKASLDNGRYEEVASLLRGMPGWSGLEHFVGSKVQVEALQEEIHRAISAYAHDISTTGSQHHENQRYRSVQDSLNKIDSLRRSMNGVSPALGREIQEAREQLRLKVVKHVHEMATSAFRRTRSEQTQMVPMLASDITTLALILFEIPSLKEHTSERLHNVLSDVSARQDGASFLFYLGRHLQEVLPRSGIHPMAQ